MKIVPKLSKHQLATFREELIIKFMLTYVQMDHKSDNAYELAEIAVNTYMKQRSLQSMEIESDCGCIKKKQRIASPNKPPARNINHTIKPKVGTQGHKGSLIAGIVILVLSVVGIYKIGSYVWSLF